MSITVDLVSGGLDWPAIAAAGATVIAAIGGIWATARQASRAREAASEDLRRNLETVTNNLQLSLRAEDQRARRAEKRQIYAECQASFWAMGTVILMHRRERSTGATHDINGLYEATENMNKAISLVELIAPEGVIDLADRARESYMDFVAATYRGAEFGADEPGKIGEVVAKLNQAMRDDLVVGRELDTPRPPDRCR